MRAWFLGTHALAAAATLRLPLGGVATGAALAVLLAHAGWRWPRAIGRIVRAHDGGWALPDERRTGLRLAPTTRFGDWWVELRLADGDGVRVVLLCRDQLDAGSWRLLQATLRARHRSSRLS